MTVLSSLEQRLPTAPSQPETAPQPEVSPRVASNQDASPRETPLRDIGARDNGLKDHGPQDAGQLIVVASGKGGVGKTWCAISLSQALAEQGERVLLIDADLGLANADVQLGLEPRADIGSVISGRRTLATSATPLPTGFWLLAGRSGSGSLAGVQAEAVMAVLAEARQGWDRIILDLGAGLEPVCRKLAAAADTLLVIATNEPTSLTDAYAVLKLFRQDKPEGDARLLVNQAESEAAGLRTWRSMDRAVHTFLGHRLPLLGCIRRDPRVPEAIRSRSSLLTRSPASPAVTDIRRIARALASARSSPREAVS